MAHLLGQCSPCAFRCSMRGNSDFFGWPRRFIGCPAGAGKATAMCESFWSGWKFATTINQRADLTKNE
eukprot:4007393-Pyramimonas_sp.AAC.1